MVEQKMDKTVSRANAIRMLRGYFERQCSPRTMLSCILMLTALIGFGSSVLLLHVGMTSMGLRYPIAALFMPFMQVDSSSTRAFGGTGVGLAISQRLAGAMGGAITVSSIPGKGSIFVLHFPLSLPSIREPETQANIGVSVDGETMLAADSRQREISTASGGELLVLVVEDDKDNSILAGKMLLNLGYSCEFAWNGEEAVAAFEAGKYCAVLMDVVMPAMSWLDAARKIRDIEAEAGGHVPILALTANVMRGDRERCIAAGMDDFLAKPFKRSELAAKLADLIL